MSGELHLLQMIWEGKTPQVHARVNGAPHPKIFQQHREGSHFQDKDTWAAFIEQLKLIVKPLREKVKAEKGLAELPHCFFFLDAAHCL